MPARVETISWGPAPEAGAAGVRRTDVYGPVRMAFMAAGEFSGLLFLIILIV